MSHAENAEGAKNIERGQKIRVSAKKKLESFIYRVFGRKTKNIY